MVARRHPCRDLDDDYITVTLIDTDFNNQGGGGSDIPITPEQLEEMVKKFSDFNMTAQLDNGYIVSIDKTEEDDNA